jgi:hypothetical protein
MAQVVEHLPKPWVQSPVPGKGREGKGREGKGREVKTVENMEYFIKMMGK